MAAIRLGRAILPIIKNGAFIENSAKILQSRLNVLSVRSYGIFPPEKYSPPIVSHEKLNEIVESEDLVDSMKYSMIHPTSNTENFGLFNHPRVMQFQNYVMLKANRNVAREVLEETFYLIKKRQLAKYYRAETEEEKSEVELDPLKVFLSAVENCRPKLYLVDITRGGIEYKVPMPTTEKRSYYMSMKWFVKASKDKPKRSVTFAQNLSNELIDAHLYKGRIVQKKIDLHKDCEANRAYAHYRWQSK